jgi:hypothetical protein
MITKQQKFIEDNDIVGNSSHDKALDLFLDEANDIIDDQENEE